MSRDHRAAPLELWPGARAINLVGRSSGLALAFAGLAWGCASGGAAPFAEPRFGVEPGVLPAEELGTQRLLRARLRGPDGRGRFRLNLRLESAERYRLDATHPLFNRRLWALEVVGEQALMVDYIQDHFCRYEGTVEIAALPIGPFTFDALPALLLGYLPTRAASGPKRGSDGTIFYRDTVGRRWTVSTGDSGVEHWQMGEPEALRASWSTDGQWAEFSAPEEGIRLRWRETLREPLPAARHSLEVPGGFGPGECDLGWMREVEGTLEDVDS